MHVSPTLFEDEIRHDPSLQMNTVQSSLGQVPVPPVPPRLTVPPSEMLPPRLMDPPVDDPPQAICANDSWPMTLSEPMGPPEPQLAMAVTGPRTKPKRERLRTNPPLCLRRFEDLIEELLDRRNAWVNR
jgi:hypothetical protein